MMHQSLKLAKMKLSTTVTTARILHGEILRHLSTSTAASTTTKSFVNRNKEKHKGFLYQKLYDLGKTGGKVSDVLNSAIKSGYIVPKSTLIDCLKGLRKIGRYQQCLEILDWLEKRRIDYSGSDFALRLAILCKLKGLTEAENCFHNIPSDMKDQSAYGSLLYCYCTQLATEKALDLFKKMDDLGYITHILSFNNLLDLYMKVGQPEKVPELIAEIKRRNISLNPHTYSFWIQSYRRLGDVEGVERVYNESQEHEFIKDDWVIHRNVASVFVEFNQPEKSVFYLKKLEDILDNAKRKPNRIPYNHLISLYATVGESDSVIRVWDKLTSKFNVNNVSSYTSILQALSKLDDIKKLEKYYQEWESKIKNYGEGFDKIPAVVIGTYLKHEMLKQAEELLNNATKKAGKELRRLHIKFMNYYFEKRETELALKHMEVAINTKWIPLPDRLDSCFEIFNSKKDVDGLEKFCGLLKRSHALDAKGYLWLLRTYVDAGKTSPDMRERMKKEWIPVSPGIEELLEKVCPIQFRACSL